VYLRKSFVGNGWLPDEGENKEALQENSIETNSNFQQKSKRIPVLTSRGEYIA
jgi:hypothetical protein